MLCLNRTPLNARLAAGRPCCAAARACCRPRPARRLTQYVRAAAVRTAPLAPETGPVCRELLRGAFSYACWKSLSKYGWQEWLVHEPDMEADLFQLAARVARYWTHQCGLMSSNKSSWDTPGDVIADLLVLKAYQEYQSQLASDAESAAPPSDGEPAALSYTEPSGAAIWAALDAVLLGFLQHAVALSFELPAASSAAAARTRPAGAAGKDKSAKSTTSEVMLQMGKHKVRRSVTELQEFVSAAQSSLARVLVVTAATHEERLQQLQSKLDQQSGLLQTLLAQQGQTQGPVMMHIPDAKSSSGAAGSSSSSNSTSSIGEAGADAAMPAAAGASGSLPAAGSPAAGLYGHLLALKRNPAWTTTGFVPGCMRMKVGYPDWCLGSDGRVVASKRLLELRSYDASGAHCSTAWCSITATALPIRLPPVGDASSREIGVELRLVLEGSGVSGFEGEGPAVPVTVKASSSAMPRCLSEPVPEGPSSELRIPASISGNLEITGRGLCVRWVVPGDAFGKSCPSEVELDLRIDYEFGL